MRELYEVLDIVERVTGLDPTTPTRKREYVFSRMLYVRVVDISHNGPTMLKPFTLSAMAEPVNKTMQPYCTTAESSTM